VRTGGGGSHAHQSNKKKMTDTWKGLGAKEAEGEKRQKGGDWGIRRVPANRGQLWGCGGRGGKKETEKHLHTGGNETLN